MGIVEARIWRFEIVPNDGGLPRVEAHQVAEGSLPVNLARVVHINALACDLRKVVDYRVRLHEARLLTSYLTALGPLTPLAVDYLAYANTSSHIRRFISECAGLGVLTASSETLFSWRPGAGALHSFDVLPTFLKPNYGGLGVRPDLLFNLSSGAIAGEARGRHRSTKALFPDQPTSDQRSRLLQLADWSASKTDHPYFMSWVWIGRTGIGVDIFLPQAEGWDGDVDLTSLDQQVDGRHWSIFPEPRRRDDHGRTQADDLHPPMRVASAEPLIQVASADPLMGVDEGRPRVQAALANAEREVGDVASYLYETARSEAGTLFDVPVQGEWVSADALGPAHHEVFIGVLAEQLDAKTRPRSRPIDREPIAAGVDTHLAGRLLTMVKPLTVSRPRISQLEGLFPAEGESG